MLKFALVGCGRIAKRYSDIFFEKQIADACLTAVCDTKIERAKAMAARHGVRWFDDMRHMLDEMHHDIDVVAVLTESGNHATHVCTLAKYGKHIIVEKPMALRLADADQMIRACDAAGIKLFVVKQNRYNLPVQKLREAVAAGRFGKIFMGGVRVRWCRTKEYYAQDAWRGTWGLDGGVFANQASHHIDLLEWMMGNPVSVYAKSLTALAQVETEDTGVAIIRFANGALGTVEATTATRPRDLEGSISILGEMGSVEIGGFAMNEMRVWDFVNKLSTDADAVTRYRQNPPNVYGFGHIEYLRHVAESIRIGKPALVDGLEGRKSLELICAMYESIETGQEVPLRYIPQRCRLGMK